MRKTSHAGSYKVQADAVAKARGGFCLSQKILTVTGLALWKCSVKEHPAWSAQFQLVRGFPSRPGTWCPVCRRAEQRHSVEHVRQALQRRGIKLLSTEFNGVEKPIRCECLRCGYVWQTKYRHIKKGHGCRECKKRITADKQRFTYKYVAEFLKQRGITLLSKTYKSTFSLIDCRCDLCGHEWHPQFGNVKAGSGCPRCADKRRNAKRRYSHKFVSVYLDERGIDLLSTEYVNSAKKLRVRFRACGHESSASFNAIQQGLCCPKCADNARVTRKEYEALAHDRSGHLIEMAKSVRHQSTWQCGRGHKFHRAYSVLLQTETFCTVCSAGLAERQCKTAVEQLFRVPFRKVRLKGLRGIGGGPLELDIYSAFLKLAIEHNGWQHYEPQMDWGGKPAFMKQLEHDRRRRDFCQKNGITLIEIRELNTVTQISDLKQIIKDACVRGGVPLPSDFDEIELDLNPANVKTSEEEMWGRILKRANEVNYAVVSKGYPGVHGKLRLICINGHPYTPRTVQFLTGYLCRKCWLNEKRVPVVAFPLTSKCQVPGAKVGQVFDSIEQAAKAIQANPNNVRTVAKGRKQTCRGYGIVQITLKQAEAFKKSPQTLREFCEERWPDWETFDPLAAFRLRFGKPVILSDGRRFNSASEAARELGVTKASVLGAIRDGGKCCGFGIKQIPKG